MTGILFWLSDCNKSVVKKNLKRIVTVTVWWARDQLGLEWLVKNLDDVNVQTVLAAIMNRLEWRA